VRRLEGSVVARWWSTAELAFEIFWYESLILILFV